MGQWRGGRDSRLSRVRGVPRRASARHLRARTSRRVDAGSLVARQRSERAGRAGTVGPPDRRSGSARASFPTGAPTMTQTDAFISPLLSPSSGTLLLAWARSIAWCWPDGLSGRAQPWTWCATRSSSAVGVPAPLSPSRAASIDRRSLRMTCTMSGADRQLRLRRSTPRSPCSSSTVLRMRSCHRSDPWSRWHDFSKRGGASRSGR